MSGILIIDDEPDTLVGIRTALEFQGCERIRCCGTVAAARQALADERWPVVFCDINLPDGSGLELLDGRGDSRVVMMSGQDEIDLAVRCIKLGASDYLVKPVDAERLMGLVDQFTSLETTSTRSDAIDDGIVSQDRGMAALYTYLQAVAPSREPVLITGETGTGKECFARAVHRRSGCDGAFVPVNVASLDEQLFGDSLFGHRKGAFTGADRERQGLVEAAAGGTLFLDEIGDLAPASQAALLRLIQEGEFYRIGEDRPRRSDARIVVATNRPIGELGDRFRSDLYYRLRVHHIDLPALRQRPGDIPLLLDHFLSTIGPHYDSNLRLVDSDLRARFCAYGYPGNIRELRGLVIDLILRHRNGLPLEDCCPGLGAAPPPAGVVDPGERLPTIAEATDRLIDEALRRADGNMSAAARMLGITRQGLYKRLGRTR